MTRQVCPEYFDYCSSFSTANFELGQALLVPVQIIGKRPVGLLQCLALGYECFQRLLVPREILPKILADPFTFPDLPFELSCAVAVLFKIPA